jgi:hypothetical protein
VLVSLCAVASALLWGTVILLPTFAHVSYWQRIQVAPLQWSFRCILSSNLARVRPVTAALTHALRLGTWRRRRCAMAGYQSCRTWIAPRTACPSILATTDSKRKLCSYRRR